MNDRSLVAFTLMVILVVGFRNSKYYQIVADHNADHLHDQVDLFTTRAVPIPLGSVVDTVLNASVVGEKGWINAAVNRVSWRTSRVEKDGGGNVQRKQKKRAVMLGLRNTLWFYPMRRGGYQDAGFQTDLRRFDNYGLLRGRFMNVKNDVDAVVCLVKYYCWSGEIYKTWETLPHVRTNKILGSKEIWSTKASYCLTLRKALRAGTAVGASHLRAFTFECWVLPRNGAEVKERLSQLPTINTFIVKPLAAQAGSGISLADAKELPSLLAKKLVLQPYLENPYLIDGRKWDMRIYVLVTSVTPVRAYMYSGGFVRFAAGNYSGATTSGKSSFLTNLSVNNKLRSTEDLTWTVSKLRQFFGVHADKVFRDIQRALAKMLVASEIPFKQLYQRTLGPRFRCKNCYQILGMDVILDANRKPYIIEVNGNPTLRFKADKLNADVKAMEAAAVRVMYDRVDENINEEVASKVRSACEQDELRCSWLNKDHVEYLYYLSKEASDVPGFTRIYPPRSSSSSKQEWDAYLSYLFANSTERQWFHSLLRMFEGVGADD